MRRRYQNIQRNSTTRLILLNKQINYLLIRVAAFSLPLHVKSNAHINVKKKEKEEFVQENHLSHLKKNARKEDLIVKNQEKVKEAQNLKKHLMTLRMRSFTKPHARLWNITNIHGQMRL